MNDMKRHAAYITSNPSYLGFSAKRWARQQYKAASNVSLFTIFASFTPSPFSENLSSDLSKLTQALYTRNYLFGPANSGPLIYRTILATHTKRPPIPKGHHNFRKKYFFVGFSCRIPRIW